MNSVRFPEFQPATEWASGGIDPRAHRCWWCSVVWRRAAFRAGRVWRRERGESDDGTSCGADDGGSGDGDDHGGILSGWWLAASLRAGCQRRPVVRRRYNLLRIHARVRVNRSNTQTRRRTDAAIGGRGIGGKRSSIYRRRAMQAGHEARCASTASMRVRRSRDDSASVPVAACSAWSSVHSGSPLAARAASRSSMPARHVSHCTTRRAGLMRPRSHADTTAGVRFSSAAMASCVRPRRWRVAMSSSGDTDEAWPRRRPAATHSRASHSPAPRRRGPVASEYLSLAWWPRWSLWCIQRLMQQHATGMQRMCRTLVSTAVPQVRGATTTANPAKAGDAKLWRLPRVLDGPARHARPAAERSLGKGSLCAQRTVMPTVMRITPSHRTWRLAPGERQGRQRCEPRCGQRCRRRRPPSDSRRHYARRLRPEPPTPRRYGTPCGPMWRPGGMRAIHRSGP